jgi:hypothetical protein
MSTAAENKTYYTVSLVDGGRLYTESPEEQALAFGPRLLRLFTTTVEAERYRVAVQEYLGEQLKVQSVTVKDVRSTVNKIRQPVKIDLCKMPENEWPKHIATLVVPR